jgi:hypothetical protein
MEELIMKNNRNEILVNRLFDILSNGGEWAEMFLIRDMLMEEYINGNFSQVAIIQIDDMIEEALSEFLEECYIDTEEHTHQLEELYSAFSRKNIGDSIYILNEYGDERYSHPYIYYSAVRELERITGENYIELCI